MKITVTRPSELGDAEVARWHDLQRATPGMDDPFLSPEFTQAVGRVLDRARVAVLEDPTDGIVGFLPFERGPLGVGQPIGAELLGGQGLIHAPGLELDPRELLRGCGLTVWEFTDLLPHQTLLSPYRVGATPCPVVDLSAGYDHWVKERRQFSKSLVKNAEMKGRRMQRDLGEVRFTFDVPAGDPRHQEGLRAVLRWKSAQYRRTGRTDRFAMPWMVQLIDDLAHTRTDACTGVLSVLYAGDRPVAGHFGLAGAKMLTYKFPTYDTGVAYYSPGLLLNLRLAEGAATAGLHEINLGTGDFDYKHRFKSYDLMVGQGYVQRPSARAAARWLRREPVRRLTGVVVGNPRLRRAADGTLRLLGRARTAFDRHGGSRVGAEGAVTAAGGATGAQQPH